MKHFSFVALALSLVTTVSAHDHGEHVRKWTFVKNHGQWSGGFLYRADVIGATAFMEKDGITWVKLQSDASDIMHGSSELPSEERNAIVLNGHAWRMRFENAAALSPITESGKAKAYHNYFLGNDPRQWKGHVPLFEELRYGGVWKGIDVVFHQEKGHLKYDIHVAPGAKAADIALGFTGLDGMKLDDQGRLVMGTSVGEVMEMVPVAFYADGAKEPVECRFSLKGNTLGFELPQGYDHQRALIIDPLLIASTLSGATGASNYGHCATYDDQGNIYTGARNFGPSYPATTGAFQTNMGGGGTDMSFSKYNPDGSDLIWASYLGGNSGENPHSMIVDSDQALVVLGSTNSSNFPVTQGCFDNSLSGTEDAVVTHFSPDAGTLIGSTFVGGSGDDGLNSMFANYGEAYRGEVFLDAAENIMVASVSSSTDFPVTAGAFQGSLGGGQDAVVFRMNPSCTTMMAATYLGAAQDDNGMGIRVADNGEVIVTGITESSAFPVGAGGYQETFQGGEADGYVVRLSADLTQRVAGSFFGASDAERSYFVDLDNEGSIWIYGQCEGTGIAINPASIYGQAGGHLFIAKFTEDLSTLPVSTVFGTAQWGGTVSAPVAFMVDECNHIYISGYNSTDGLETTEDALYEDLSFYLAMFDVGMASMIYGTYYGGSHVDGGTSRFDKNGIVYQGVCSGTGSLQTTSWAWATNQSIGWDIGVFKIQFDVDEVNADATLTALVGCAVEPVQFFNGSNGHTWFWDFGDNSPIESVFETTHTYAEPGVYEVMLVAVDTNSCNLRDTTYLDITIGELGQLEAAFTLEQVVDCSGFFVTGMDQMEQEGLVFHWDMGDGTVLEGDSIFHEYEDFGGYEVMFAVSDITGCSLPDTLWTTIEGSVDILSPQVPDTVICIGGTVPLDATLPFTADYLWSTGSTDPVITVDEPGVYVVDISANNCTGTDTIAVVPSPIYALELTQYTCPGQPTTFTIPVSSAMSYIWSTGGTEQQEEVPGEEETYGYTVIDRYGCEHSDSAHVLLYEPYAQLFAPNAFSPNGDGINDEFIITGLGQREMEMTIYDRWGQLVYTTTSMSQPWNGEYKGVPAPLDVYVYHLRYTAICNTDKQATYGHVTVLR